MKKQKKKSKSSHFIHPKKAVSLLILFFFFVVTVVIIAAVSYNLGYEEAKDEVSLKLYQAKEEQTLLRKRLKDRLDELNRARDENTFINEEPNRMKHIKKVDVKDVFVPKKRPKLAIILDDVSYASEVDAVKKLGIKVNFSFFPPTKKHPDTAKLASKEPFYMVHLPLEAMNYHAEEPETLRINDTFKTIYMRLKWIKERFPRLKYLNNHTGSKFTSNRQAVTKLIKAARRLNLEIVDSRTIASTKIPEVNEKYHLKFFQRDVFLDHKSDVNYICGQIKEVVDLALKKGHAIAIGHPRVHTIRALQKCKALFKPVELVYLKEL